MISQNLLYAEAKADLYSTVLPDGWYSLLIGETVRLDTPLRVYLYNGSSTATDDGETVIKPTAVSGAGRWLKQAIQQLQADWNQSSSTALDFIKNKPSLPSAPTQSTVSRTLNSSFRPSTTNTTIGIYSVSISVTSALLGTNSGTITLQISPDNITFSTITQIGLSEAGVASTGISTSVISGTIPVGYYAKLVTTQTGTNGATITYITGQETLL